MYLTPDLTAENLLYRKDNDVRMIISAEQKLTFTSPIYSDTIDMILMGTQNQTLIKGIDWTVRSEDIAIESTSQMRLIDRTFNKELVRSITIIKPYVADYKIFMTYQMLYPEHSKVALNETEEVLEFTPDLLTHILQLLRAHDRLLSPITDVHSPVERNPRMFEIDQHKELPENFVSNELHSVNTLEQIHTIHPIGGAFFKDSLIVEKVDPTVSDPMAHVPENVLIPGVDYKVFGCDYHKTSMTKNTSGVYRFVLFTKAFVGQVKVSYHAYGGDPTLYDIRQQEESIDNIRRYVLESQLLTPKTLGNTPQIITISNRILELEEKMRILAQQGRPSYGDVSHGGTLIKKITSVDDELHWYTIAELFKVDGSEEVFVADIMRLSIQTLYTKFTFDALVNVNIEHPTDRLEVACTSATYPKGYIPFEDYSQIENIIRPQFRIIWNENTVEGSGIFLQIGMRLKGYVEETLAIEDMSGQQSAWKLIPTPVEASLPEDNLIALPSNNHTWDVLNPNSRSESQMIPFPDGHLIWAGQEALNRPNSGWMSHRLVHLLEKDTDIRKIKQIRCDLTEEGGNRFPIMFNFIRGSEKLQSSTTFNYNGKPSYMVAQITRNAVNGNIDIDIAADIVAGPTANRLDLSQVLVFF